MKKVKYIFRNIINYQNFCNMCDLLRYQTEKDNDNLTINILYKRLENDFSELTYWV